MNVRFRNVDVPDSVRDWPYEAITTTIERGTIGDWAVLTREIGRDPWGPVARQVEGYLEYADEPGVAALFRRRIASARACAERGERDEAAERVAADTHRADDASEPRSEGSAARQLPGGPGITRRVPAPQHESLVAQRVEDPDS